MTNYNIGERNSKMGKTVLRVNRNFDGIPKNEPYKRGVRGLDKLKGSSAKDLLDKFVDEDDDELEDED